MSIISLYNYPPVIWERNKKKYSQKKNLENILKDKLDKNFNNEIKKNLKLKRY
jgi:hypothetical protein